MNEPTESAPKGYWVLSNGQRVGITNLVRKSGNRNGWEFMPLFQAHPTRKLHATAADAIKSYRLGPVTWEARA